MKHGPNSRLSLLCGFLLIATAPALADQPSPDTLAAYQNYVAAVEARLAHQHSTAANYLAASPFDSATELRLRHGGLLLEDLTPPAGLALPGALLHHWRATAFVAGAKAADFDRLLRDFPTYPRAFAPQILSARILSQSGDHLQVRMRIRQRHVLTVVLDTTWDITFTQLDPHHQSSASSSTAISEIDNPGTPAEHPLTPAQDHGYLWRQNTWWTWEERDGGLCLQLESVSLTRSIPYGLAWAIGPYITSIPRESLAFTLRSAAYALQPSTPHSPGKHERTQP